MGGPPPRRWAAAALAHPRHVALAATVAGLVLGPRAGGAAWWLALVPAVAAVTGAACAGAVGGRLALVLCVAAAGVLGGAWAARARERSLDHTALGPWIGHAADTRATVLQAPRSRGFGRTVALVRIAAGPGTGERVLVQVKGPLRARVGDELRVRGGFRALPGYEQAMRRQGAHALLAADRADPTGRRRGGLLGFVDGVRRRSQWALTRGLPPSVAALARGMVLGEDEALAPATQADFRASGLAHLVAASGANVALLGAMVLALGAALGLARTLRLGLTLVVIALYVPLAGGGPSIQRAGIMGIAALVAALASQPASRAYVLLLAAAVTLALNPRAAEDPGWQLSFAAVLALALLATPLRGWLRRRRPGLPAAAADAVAVCVTAAAATAPLIALAFGRLSWVTVPANLLAVPAVAPVMWLGTAAAVVGQAWTPAAMPLMLVAQWPLAFLSAVGHLFAMLPGAQAHVRLPLAAALGWWAGLVVLAVPRARSTLATWWRAARRRSGVLGDGGTARRRVLLLVPLALGLLIAATAGAPATGGTGAGAAPPGLVVSALDVGQGDATLIQDGSRAILVDAGPPDGAVVRRLAEAGVRRLDLLVVTHAQADHDGGAAAVLDALPVAAVLDGRDGVADPDGARFAAAAVRHGARRIVPAAGQTLRVGPLELDVLSPRPEPAALHAGEDPNRRAIVAELHDGAFSMLLTADAESDVLAGLPLGPVDVLKVSHHGSADPGLPALLARLRPAVALVEVGAHNPYGHPAPQTMAELRAVAHVLRTDRDGTIRLRVVPGPHPRMVIQTHS